MYIYLADVQSLGSKLAKMKVQEISWHFSQIFKWANNDYFTKHKLIATNKISIFLLAALVFIYFYLIFGFTIFIRWILKSKYDIWQLIFLLLGKFFVLFCFFFFENKITRHVEFDKKTFHLFFNIICVWYFWGQ